jgi:hypothetical protein
MSREVVKRIDDVVMPPEEVARLLSPLAGYCAQHPETGFTEAEDIYKRIVQIYGSIYESSDNPDRLRKPYADTLKALASLYQSVGQVRYQLVLCCLFARIVCIH